MKPITYCGVDYPSITAAAEAIGITKEGMRKRLKFVRKETPRRSSKKGITKFTDYEAMPMHKHKRVCVIDGVEYESILEASRQLGINYPKLHYRFRAAEKMSSNHQ